MTYWGLLLICYLTNRKRSSYDCHSMLTSEVIIYHRSPCLHMNRPFCPTETFLIPFRQTRYRQRFRCDGRTLHQSIHSHQHTGTSQHQSQQCAHDDDNWQSTRVNEMAHKYRDPHELIDIGTICWHFFLEISGRQLIGLGSPRWLDYNLMLMVLFHVSYSSFDCGVDHPLWVQVQTVYYLHIYTRV